MGVHGWETNVLSILQTQARFYSIPYEDKVAKFKGKKGSDVGQPETQPLYISVNWLENPGLRES